MKRALVLLVALAGCGGSHPRAHTPPPAPDAGIAAPAVSGTWDDNLGCLSDGKKAEIDCRSHASTCTYEPPYPPCCGAAGCDRYYREQAMSHRLHCECHCDPPPGPCKAP